MSSKVIYQGVEEPNAEGVQETLDQLMNQDPENQNAEDEDPVNIDDLDDIDELEDQANEANEDTEKKPDKDKENPEDNDTKEVGKDTDTTEDTQVEDSLEFDLPGTLNPESVKAKAPDAFKEFPELEQILQEHRTIRGMVDSPEDIIKMARSSEMFENMTIDLSRGDLSGMFASIATYNPQSWQAIKDNIVDNLNFAEKGVVGNIVDGELRKDFAAMMKDAESRNDAQLLRALATVSYARWRTTDLQEAPETDRERQMREQMESSQKESKEAYVNNQFEQLQYVFGQQRDQLIKEGFRRAGIGTNEIYNDWVISHLEQKVAGDEDFGKRSELINQRALELGQYSEKAMQALQRGYLGLVRKHLPETLRTLRKSVQAKQGNNPGNAKPGGEQVPRKSTRSTQLSGGGIPDLDKIDPESYDGPEDLLNGNYTLL